MKAGDDMILKIEVSQPDGIMILLNVTGIIQTDCSVDNPKLGYVMDHALLNIDRNCFEPNVARTTVSYHAHHWD